MAGAKEITQWPLARPARLALKAIGKNGPSIQERDSVFHARRLMHKCTRAKLVRSSTTGVRHRCGEVFPIDLSMTLAALRDRLAHRGCLRHHRTGNEKRSAAS